MATILVTGGAGFIPSNLAERLAQDHQVVAIDNFLTGRRANIPEHKNIAFIKADANNFQDLAAIFAANSFDYVFHYAAVVGVKRTLENPIMVLRDIEGFKYILDLAKNSGVRRVFFSSSSEVYGEPVEIPQSEHTTPLNSRLPYAVVKNVGESFMRSYKKEYGLDYTIFRFFNTYGPKQSPDFVVAKFLRAALANEDITIYGDGKQTRTFCYIDDNTEATVKALNDESTVDDVINIGNDDEITINELAETIVRVTKSKSKLVHLPPLEEGDMRRRQPDIARMKKLLDHPLTSLETGLKKLIEFEQKRSAG